MATLAARVTALAQAVAADVKAILSSLGDKAGKGANSDITSLSGLTTPLSVAQGGTGNTNGNAATATKLATARTLNWTGDVTGSTTYDGSVNSSAALTLAASGVAAGNYGPITVNAKGLVTSIAAVAAAGANSDITSLTGITGSVRIGRSATLGTGMNYPVQVSATSTSGIALARFSADGNGPFMAFGKGRGSSVGGAAVTKGDPLGTFQFLGDTGSAWAVAAQFSGYVDGDPSSTSMPGGITFLTTPIGSISSTERMRINSAGSVLIGKSTDDGVARLQVGGPVSITAPLLLGTYTLSTLPSASSYSGYLIQVSNASRGWALCRSSGTSWIDLYTQAAVA